MKVRGKLGNRYWINEALSVLFLSVLATAAFGADYYVDSTRGADANSGHEADQAWRSLDKVNETGFPILRWRI